MNLKDFTADAPGQLVPIGGSARAYVPHPLPPRVAVTPEIQQQHELALLSLGELRAIIPSLPNPGLITTPFLRREAVLSSRIEGTHTEVEQLYLFEASEPALRRGESDDVRDAREVLNYVRALQHGLDALPRLPVCHRLIREMHAILMRGVRGKNKSPGQYRKCQNYIGRGGSIRRARFVPPPPESVQPAMDELERYINESPSGFPSLVKIAMVHCQFETIHPFEDGNGRVGRLLITLLLSSYGLLREPLLYISAFFERNRDEYNDRMLHVSQSNAWNEWIGFFLQGVIEEAQDAGRRARRLLNLREQWRDKLQRESGSSNILALIDALFSFPVTTITAAKDKLSMSYRGAQLNIEKLESDGFLREVTGHQRNKRYVATLIMEILKADEA